MKLSTNYKMAITIWFFIDFKNLIKPHVNNLTNEKQRSTQRIVKI